MPANAKRKRDTLRAGKRTAKSVNELVVIKKALANTVRSSRQKKGWSQIDLANLLGSSQSRIAKVEAGDSSVSLDLMVRALLKIGATTNELSSLLGAKVH